MSFLLKYRTLRLRSIFQWDGVFSQLKTHTHTHTKHSQKQRVAGAYHTNLPKNRMKFISSKPHLHNARTHLETIRQKRNGIGRKPFGNAEFSMFTAFFLFNFYPVFSTDPLLIPTFTAKAVTKFKCSAQMTCSRSLAREIFLNACDWDIWSTRARYCLYRNALSIVKEHLTRSFVNCRHSNSTSSSRLQFISHLAEVNATKCYTEMIHHF